MREVPLWRFPIRHPERHGQGVSAYLTYEVHPSTLQIRTPDVQRFRGGLVFKAH